MNTQLVFPLDIHPKRFTTCAAIGHWSSGCHNSITLGYSYSYNFHMGTIYLEKGILLGVQYEVHI